MIPTDVQSLEHTFAVLGNAGAVPVVIFLTQLIKKRVGDFKYGSDLLALAISFILCFGWTFYNMSASDFSIWKEMTGLDTFRWVIDQLISGFATWLAASKIYDLGHGNKKHTQKVAALQKEIVRLKATSGENNGKDTDNPTISDKLREILEGK